MGLLVLEFVNSILSKSCVQQPIMSFCMLCSLQYRLIWNRCFTFRILYLWLSGWSVISLWTRRSAQCLDYRTRINKNSWCSIDARLQDTAGSMSLLFWPIKAPNIRWMDVYNQLQHKLPNMQRQKLLTLCWCSFSGCGREHVAVVFPTNGCQYLMNGCLQPIGT